MLEPVTTYLTDDVVAACELLTTKITDLEAAQLQCLGRQSDHIGALDRQLIHYMERERVDLAPLFSWSQLIHFLQGAPRPLADLLARETEFELSDTVEAVSLLSSPSDDTLLAFAGRVLHEDLRQYRSHSVSTAPDRMGVRTSFQDAETISENMAQIFCHLVKPDEKLPPMLTALWVMVAFMTVHPLPNGNGRVGRMLFHASLIRQGVLKTPVLPLVPLTYAANGFFEVCMKRWQLDGQVDMLQQYMWTILGFYEGLDWRFLK